MIVYVVSFPKFFPIWFPSKMVQKGQSPRTRVRISLVRVWESRFAVRGLGWDHWEPGKAMARPWDRMDQDAWGRLIRGNEKLYIKTFIILYQIYMDLSVIWKNSPGRLEFTTWRSSSRIGLNTRKWLGRPTAGPSENPELSQTQWPKKKKSSKGTGHGGST